ncbi:rhodanese-like domain-containing protein [Listeria valentina]|uniref:rhodanese-like domain-containing protein n=1 Tax=Listeria valentina TaxID=2705293 RepID=UPI0014300ABD|nr:rhodanese-like domain-containing protein [Listeria valentina]
MFQKIPSIQVAELIELKNPVIIDVRESYEFQAGHIPKAKNVPLSKIASYEPQGTTYLICASGMRSKRATKMLLKKGYDVINIRGGMSQWQGPTKGGAK